MASDQAASVAVSLWPRRPPMSCSKFGGLYSARSTQRQRNGAHGTIASHVGRGLSPMELRARPRVGARRRRSGHCQRRAAIGKAEEAVAERSVPVGGAQQANRRTSAETIPDTLGKKSGPSQLRHRAAKRSAKPGEGAQEAYPAILAGCFPERAGIRFRYRRVTTDSRSR